MNWRQERDHLVRYPNSPPDATEWAESHSVDGFPDFGKFDDTLRDALERTDRDRAMQHYYDLLAQRRDLT